MSKKTNCIRRLFVGDHLKTFVYEDVLSIAGKMAFILQGAVIVFDNMYY